MCRYPGSVRHRRRWPIEHVVAANEDGARNLISKSLVVDANMESDVALAYEDVGWRHDRAYEESMKVGDDMIGGGIQRT